jgi:ADP-ribosylglycohydrolase
VREAQKNTEVVMEEKTLRSKVLGAMVGSALGDAIGERCGHWAAIANKAGLKGFPHR